MQPPDSALLARIARDDQEALQHLYERHSAALYAHVSYQLQGNDIGIDEVMQDTFLAVWRSAAGYRGEARVKTWLFRIANNVIFQSRRQAVRRHSATAPLTETTVADHAPASPEDIVITRLALADAIAQLSEKHHIVLELVLVQGFSLEEVAQYLDIPVGTVKSRLSYARRALMTHLTTTIAGE